MTKPTSAPALATPAASGEASQPTEQATFAVYLWLSEDEEMRFAAASIVNASGDDQEAGLLLRDCAERAIGHRPVLLSARIQTALMQDVDWSVIAQSFRANNATE
ncbi:MAG: hypothetical protein J0H14_03195 [Alphaproteobacteria bacterium]|nr:hypothetical protein [Alphaproteobacteria bacterium]